MRKCMIGKEFIIYLFTHMRKSNLKKTNKIYLHNLIFYHCTFTSMNLIYV